MDIVERLRKYCENPLAYKAADEIERLQEENNLLRGLLQNWLANCFVDVYGQGVTFGMGVKKVWAETRTALGKDK